MRYMRQAASDICLAVQQGRASVSVTEPCWPFLPGAALSSRSSLSAHIQSMYQAEGGTVTLYKEKPKDSLVHFISQNSAIQPLQSTREAGKVSFALFLMKLGLHWEGRKVQQMIVID